MREHVCDSRHPLTLGTQLAGGEQRKPGTAKQDVADAARLLAPCGERDLREDVGMAGDDRLGELGALARECQDIVSGVAIAGRERTIGTSGTPGRRSSSSASMACPSGISCVRQGASRASRSTSRSTVCLAMRRQVVSLPPVIVSTPESASYSSALREMSVERLGSPLDISGRTPAKAPARSPAQSAVPKKSFTALSR